MSREGEAVREMLREAPIPADGVLVVHSAFRTLGRQGYRVEALIEALRERLGGRATVLMPAMSWRTVTPANPFFDELATASHVGVVAETFRIAHATARSLHPTHSVSGVGPAAPTLLARHHVDDTPVSANSPYGLIRDYDAFVLTLGVGFERVTAIHHAEEVVAPDIYLRPLSEIETYECRTRHGTSRTVRLRRHLRLNRDFPQFEARLAEQGRLLSGDVAGTRWLLASIQHLLQVVFAALIERPDAIIAPVPAGGQI